MDLLSLYFFDLGGLIFSLVNTEFLKQKRSFNKVPEHLHILLLSKISDLLLENLEVLLLQY